MRVRVPGKLVIVGEYAVLDGAPAIVAAVDRGVQVDVSPAEAPGAGMLVEAPGDDRFVKATLAAVNAPPARYRFRDWNPVGTSTKAGFGGSAAACVAAAIAGGATDVWKAADAAHRAVQGGGSGIDVAASVHGGWLRFERAPHGMPTVMPLVAPKGLRLVVVWSGQSASTGPRVERYLGWTPRDAFVADSRALVDGFAADPVGALREGYKLLRAMTRAAGIDWETPALAEIAALARRCGGSAKPSGAGGGDIAVALLPHEGAERVFRDACAAQGYVVIDVNIAPAAGVVPETA